MRLDHSTLASPLAAVSAAVGAFVMLALAAADFFRGPAADWRMAAVAIPVCAGGLALLVWARVTLRMHPPTFGISRLGDWQLRVPYPECEDCPAARPH